MDAKTATTARPRRGGRIREWLLRYAPAEVGALLGALAGAIAIHRYGSAALTAYAGALGEGIGFYAVMLVRGARSRRRLGLARRPALRALRDLLLEFGTAELLDSLIVRPFAMYAGPILTGNLATGIVLGKIAADVVFYLIAIIGYEFGKALSPESSRLAQPTTGEI